MTVMSPDDPVVIAMRNKNVPMTGENYQRMSMALQTQGANGRHTPMSAKQMRDARGLMPNAKSNDWFDDGDGPDSEDVNDVDVDPNVDAEDTTDYYSRDMEEANAMQYMDELAGDGVVTAKTNDPKALSTRLMNKTANAATVSDVSNGNEVIPSVDVSTGSNENAGGGVIATLLAALAGGVGLKALMGNKTNVSASGVNDVPALREDNVESLNNQRRLSGPAELKQVGRNELKQLPAPDTIYQGAGDELKQLPKPKYRVKAGSSRDDAVTAITARGKKLNAARMAARRL